jgi:hypothetical protein
MNIEHEATFFVAVNGDDHWSGKMPEPKADRTDGPFATLARVRDAVRERKAREGLKGPITVVVREGTYFLDHTFVLSRDDSGSRECPVTYAAYPGEQPILSGGKRVTGWKPYRDKILRCELPGAKGGKWTFRQLFFNGKRQTRARWPKLNPADPLYSGWALIEGPAREGSTDAFIYKPGTFRHDWAKPTEVEVIYWASIGGWRSMVPIKTIEQHSRIITLAHSGWQFDVPGWYMPVPFTPDNRFYMENALEELTEPGEWCFDSEEGSLYFWPPTGSVEGQEVIVPALDGLVELLGVSWVTISGFTFTETTDGDNFHREGGSRGQEPCTPGRGGGTAATPCI